jgi:hypothetical protein
LFVVAGIGAWGFCLGKAIVYNETIAPASRPFGPARQAAGAILAGLLALSALASAWSLSTQLPGYQAYVQYWYARDQAIQAAHQQGFVQVTVPSYQTPFGVFEPVAIPTGSENSCLERYYGISIRGTMAPPGP